MWRTGLVGEWVSEWVSEWESECVDKRVDGWADQRGVVEAKGGNVTVLCYCYGNITFCFYLTIGRCCRWARGPAVLGRFHDQLLPGHRPEQAHRRGKTALLYSQPPHPPPNSIPSLTLHNPPIIFFIWSVVQICLHVRFVYSLYPTANFTLSLVCSQSVSHCQLHFMFDSLTVCMPLSTSFNLRFDNSLYATANFTLRHLCLFLFF